MQPLLFSADDRAGKRKRGNYAGDSSVCIYTIGSRKQLRSRVCSARLPRNFCKAKRNKCTVVLQQRE